MSASSDSTCSRIERSFSRSNVSLPMSAGCWSFEDSSLMLSSSDSSRRCSSSKVAFVSSRRTRSSSSRCRATSESMEDERTHGCSAVLRGAHRWGSVEKTLRMDRLWQWTWDRYGKRYSWAVFAMSHGVVLPIFAILALLVVAFEKSDRYLEAVAIAAVATV